MMLPRWIPFLIAAWVIAFGILRLRIAMRKDKEEGSDRPNYRKGGYYARSKRSHMLFGISYLILGAYCIAMGFGYQINFFKGCMGKSSQEAVTPASPGTMPVDTRSAPPAQESEDAPEKP